MNLPTTEKKPNTYISWEENLSEKELIGKWRDNVPYAALEKLQGEHGNIDTTSIQTTKSFCGELSAYRDKEKSQDYTIKEGKKVIDHDEFKPLGIEFTFTKISQDVATIMMNRDPSNQIQKIGDLFLPGFPTENLLKNESETADHLEFIFKTNTLVKDRFKRLKKR
jgi:hypothetical protein